MARTLIDRGAIARGAGRVAAVGLVASSLLAGCGGGTLSVADLAVCQTAQTFIDGGGAGDAAARLTVVGIGAGDRLGDAARTLGPFASDATSSFDLSRMFFGGPPIPPPAIGRVPLEAIKVPSTVWDAQRLQVTCHLHR